MTTETLALEGQTARDHETIKVLRLMSRELVDRLQGPPPRESAVSFGAFPPLPPMSAKLRKHVDAVLDGKIDVHGQPMPPPPDVKVEALRERVDAQRGQWESAARAVVTANSGGMDRRFENEVAALMTRRRAAIANERVTRAELLEDELEDMGVPPFPELLKAKAIVERRAKGLDF